jgi:hypothetical protein
MYQSVPVCTSLSQPVPACTSLYQPVPVCTNLYWLYQEYCPIIENIELPDGAHGYDVDGMPQYLIITLEQWKGNGDRKKKPQRLWIRR